MVYESVEKSRLTLMAGWMATGLALISWSALLYRLSARFGYDTAVPDMPIWTFVALLIAGGLIFLALPFLIKRTLALQPIDPRHILLIIFVVGIGVRAIFMVSEPMLEDDYQRYLWDGAQVSHGINPYRYSPEAARAAPSSTELGALARASEPVISRVNHGELRTVYPPVAQAFFGLAYKLAPFKLSAWRLIVLLVDLFIFALLYLLLKEVGRSPLWLALYWWNPVVTKELFNSAHMDILIAPFLLGAIFLTLRGRLFAAFASLAAAVGVKIWPAFLLPIFIGRAWQKNTPAHRIILASLFFGGLCLIWVLPIFLAGFDQGSGFVAYGEKWQTNSAFFPALKLLLAQIVDALAIGSEWAGRLARLAILAVFTVLSFALAREKIKSDHDFIIRCAFMVLIILLLSPAQFPWYLTWFAAFLVFLPLKGLLLLHVSIPAYYLGFHYIVIDDYDFYTNVIVWLVWVPVWGALAYELLVKRTWCRPFGEYTEQFRE